MKRKIIGVLLALVLLCSMSLVTAVPVGAAATIDVGPEATYTTIQSAIDAASAGDTINVAAGTYHENVEIDKANVILQSAVKWGAIIQPTTTITDWPSAAVIITADGVTVDGFEIDGTTIAKNGIFGLDTSGLTIKNNKIHGAVNAWDGCGITLMSWGNSGTVYNNLIQDNEVYDTGRMGIMIMDHDADLYTVTHDNTITGNTVHDVWKMATEWGDGGGGIQINVAKNCSITNNEVYNVQDGQRGIYIFGSAAGNIITGNTLRDNPTGVQLWISGEQTIPEINWGTESPASPQVRFNNIYNNDTGAISSNTLGTPMVMDAINNWWGDATGPKQATTNPNGLGDAVSDNVTYSPWLLVTKDEAGSETVVPETDFGQQSETFTGTDTTINTTGTSGTGDITVTTGLYSVPADATHPLPVDAEGERALKYIDVKIENSSYTGNVTVTMSYTDADLAEMGVKEDTLKLYYFMMTAGPWTLAANQVLDTVNNTVSGEIPASELTGTPLCLGGEATVTGQYEVGAPPSVTVNFTSTEMDPAVEQTVTVGVSVPAGESRTLAELTQVLFKVWYDADGGTPAETEFNSAAADTQTCAVITWNGTTFSLDANATDTTWVLGTCTAPTLTGTTGDFTLKFTPGKVATETTGSAKWQIAATATSEYSTGFGYDAEATTMNWYGELALGSAVNIDWGSVPAGMDFDNSKADQALGTIVTYISNGAYSKLAKSSATWVGTGSNTATLDDDGTALGSNAFSLKATNSSTYNDAVLLTTTGSLIDTGTITGETGNSEANNYLWLRLAATFDQDTYSGSITYIIQPES